MVSVRENFLPHQNSQEQCDTVYLSCATRQTIFVENDLFLSVLLLAIVLNILLIY